MKPALFIVHPEGVENVLCTQLVCGLRPLVALCLGVSRRRRVGRLECRRADWRRSGRRMTSLLSGLVPAVESLLQAAPSLAGSLSVATWVIWGLGSALPVLLGAALHMAIGMWRRRGGGSGAQARPSVAA